MHRGEKGTKFLQRSCLISFLIILVICISIPVIVKIDEYICLNQYEHIFNIQELSSEEVQTALDEYLNQQIQPGMSLNDVQEVLGEFENMSGYQNRISYGLVDFPRCSFSFVSIIYSFGFNDDDILINFNFEPNR